jgi:hypothetical protein
VQHPQPEQGGHHGQHEEDEGLFEHEGLFPAERWRDEKKCLSWLKKGRGGQ